MGLFSRLNFRAVHEAYCDIAALGFLTELNCQLFNAMTEPDHSVNISTYVDQAAQVAAQSIFELTDGYGIAHSTAISRLSEVASSYKRALKTEFQDHAEIARVTQFCWEHFYIVAQRIFRSKYNGYLSMSAAEIKMLIDVNEERMYAAVMMALDRNEAYLSEFEIKIQKLERQFGANRSARMPTNSNYDNYKCVTQGRTEARVTSDQDCLIENDRKKETLLNSEINKDESKEKTDRAVGSCSNIEIDKKVSDPRLGSGLIGAPKDSLSVSFSEPFDLLNGDGRLLAKIGIKIISGFHVLFNDGERVPLSTTLIFSTAEDNQSAIQIPLAMQSGEGQIIGIGNYKIDGIYLANRGIPQIEITIEIKNLSIKIKVADHSGKSNIKILKEA